MTCVKNALTIKWPSLTTKNGKKYMIAKKNPKCVLLFCNESKQNLIASGPIGFEGGPMTSIRISASSIP